MTLNEQDLRHLRRCVALAEESLNDGGTQFTSTYSMFNIKSSFY